MPISVYLEPLPDRGPFVSRKDLLWQLQTHFGRQLNVTENDRAPHLVAFNYELNQAVQNLGARLDALFNQSTIDNLKDAKKGFLLCCLTECFPENFLRETDNSILCAFHFWLKKFNRKPNNTLLVFPNFKFFRQYQEWCLGQREEEVFRAINIDYYERELFLQSNSKDIENALRNRRPQYQKRFLALTARAQLHRVAAFAEFLRMDLLSYMHWSFLNKDTYFRPEDVNSLQHWLGPMSASWQTQVGDFLRGSPHYLDQMDELNQVNCQLPIKAMEESGMQIVLETDMFSSGSGFLSEKTFKPILFRQPFCIFGHSGSLSYLRILGYESYPEIIDESYDNCEDPKLRFQKLLNEIKRLCRLNEKDFIDLLNQPSVIEKARHNQNLFLKRNERLDMMKSLVSAIQEISILSV